jgi:uncharacterized protein (DUF1810 family)
MGAGKQISSVAHLEGYGAAAPYPFELRTPASRGKLACTATPRHSSAMSDPFELQRFLDAQSGCHAGVLAELRVGRKRTHWMWFVFPQVEGLGFSSMAQRFAIKSREEAKAYLAHAVLGARIVECTTTILNVPRKTAHEIFGSPDDMKFHSSMTLFEGVGDNPAFGAAIDRFYGGKLDAATLSVLTSWSIEKK